MKVLDELDITDRTKLKLQVSKYRDQERIDLRQYVKIKGGFIPTRRGINFNSEWVEKFIDMVKKLETV